MADTRAARLRRHWLNVHLWIALSLVVLLVPISISGAITRLARRNRFRNQSEALCGFRAANFAAAVGLSRKAEAAVADDPAKPRAAALRYPEPGWPVRVVMRAQPREAGARPRLVTVYLDPPTGNVLDVVGLPCVVVRIPARVPRKPDNPGVQRPPDCRLGRRRNADTVTDGDLAVVATRRRFSARLALAALVALHLQPAPPSRLLDLFAARGGVR